MQQCNRILDLAEAIGAFLIVSNDTDLIAMSPWRGRPIISPDKFAALVDASPQSLPAPQIKPLANTPQLNDKASARLGEGFEISDL